MSGSRFSVATSYKKQDGFLSFSPDTWTILWKPAAGSGGPVSILISELLNLQQTPAASAKVSVKFIVQKSGQANPENFVFAFTSPTDARTEQATVTDTIRKAKEQLSTLKNAPPSSSQAAKAAEPSSGAMTFAQTVSAVAAAVAKPDSQFDEAKLLADLELHISLLNSNPTLKRQFNEALAEKPDSLSASAFAAQFWARRVNLLRKHAFEKAQMQGTYNVLSEAKPRVVEGATRLSLSKEQIQLIFKQHPIIKRMYNDLVPRLNEEEFWSKFYLSRMFKKIRGEKISDLDPVQKEIDKYLNHDLEAEDPFPFDEAHFSHLIDIEGNEADNSEKQGNRPDWTMRPNATGKVPILRILNRMSEKMLMDVEPADGNLFAPVGLTEKDWEALRLADLEDEAADTRIRLAIQDPQQFAVMPSTAQSSEAVMYSKMAPHKVMGRLQQDIKARLGRQDGSVDLEAVLGIKPAKADRDRDRSLSPGRAAGTRSGRSAASKHLMNEIRRKARYADSIGPNRNVGALPLTQLSALPISESKLPPEILDSLTNTYNTTVEFLHYFWVVFLSGDPDRAGELQQLVGTLDKSLERIKAIADAAEIARNKQIGEIKAREDEFYKRTGKRRRVDMSGITAGAVQVNKMLEPTMKAIAKASGDYQAALRAQMTVAKATEE